MLYQGFELMGGGAILTGLVLGAIGVFVIEQEVHRGLRVRVRRRGAHLLRLHARRIRRLRGDADGRGRLRHRGWLLLGVLSRAPASALDRSAPHEAIPEGALATPAE